MRPDPRSHRRRRWASGAVAAALLATVAPLAGAPPATAAPLVATDLAHGVTPQDLANALVGGGVSVSNVTYTGSPVAAGRFSGGTGILGLEQGIVLGSGRVQSSNGTCQGGKGVEGPNQCDGNTTTLSLPGDAALSALSGKPTHDATILEFDFVPAFSTVQFSYVFTSDEYNEFVNSSFNDVFGFFVNGTNCATVPGTGQPVAVNTINGGNPFGTAATNPALFRNNDPNDGGTGIATEMDGLTVVLECNATVNAGAVNHMKLAIADASDSALDSNVFLGGGTLVSGTQIATTLSGGGQTGTAITVPPGTQVVDNATLSGANADSAGGSVTYTVYSDSDCSAVFAQAGTRTVTNGVVPPSDPVTFPVPGTYQWVASYTGDALNNPVTADCGSETVTVASAGGTDLSITKSATPGPVLVGSPLTYLLTVHNHGPSSAGSVVVSDPLPAGVTFVSATPTQGTCGEAGGVVTCQVASLPVDGGYTVTVVVSPTAAGTITNTATVGSDQADLNPANDSSTVATTVQVGVSVNDVTVAEGDAGLTAATFTVALSAPAPAGGVTVQAATADGTATAPADYTARPATLVSFSEGETAKAFAVQVVGDQVDEATETFSVNLSAPAGAVVTDGQGVGTIVDDDRNGRFLCRATALRVGSGSAAVANPAESPCRDDARTVLGATLSAWPVKVVSGTLNAATNQTPDDLEATSPAAGDHGLATSTVESATVTVSPLLTVKVVAVRSQARVQCVTGPTGLRPTLSASSGTATILVNGVAIDVNANVALALPFGLGTIQTNRTVTTPTSVTRQAVRLVVLGQEIVVGEAKAGFTGNPCAQ